ncbi:unnamed protein product [Schistocephalus solidus]|uniref:Uncharacterized protein n=1 Tax=Schistocephalus solidus TaxID=70667 RepID=A0A183TBY0_SCHSO|nr:unnamed protein product [Schistocephalus solidus]
MAKFYKNLHRLQATVPNKDKMIVPGDFSPREGTDYGTWAPERSVVTGAASATATAVFFCIPARNIISF